MGIQAIKDIFTERVIDISYESMRQSLRQAVHGGFVPYTG